MKTRVYDATAWDELVVRPVEWVNAQVAKFVGREDQDWGRLSLPISKGGI